MACGRSRANPASCDDISVTPPRKTDLHPRYCKGNLPKLAPAEILPYMCMQPGEALLQGEWEKHGACDFGTAKEYFEKERELFQALKLPDTSMDEERAVPVDEGTQSATERPLAGL